MKPNKGAKAARAKARRYELLGHLGAEARALKKGLEADRLAREACAVASEEVDFRTRYRDKKSGRFISCGKGETVRRARATAGNPRRNAVGGFGPAKYRGIDPDGPPPPDADTYLREAARYALNFLYAAMDAGGREAMKFRRPVFGQGNVFDLLRDAVKAHDRHVGGYRSNPRGPTIYPRICAIEARKADGQLYRHAFKTKNPIIGLKDGSLMIPCGSRRLWGTA